VTRLFECARYRLGVLAACCAIFVASAGSAEDTAPQASEDPASRQLEAARVVVDDFHASRLEMMQRAEELGFVGRYELIEAAARKAFGLDVMARMTYGSGWTGLSEAQQTEWADTFARFHIASVADFNRGWNGQSYVDLGEERTSHGILVKTHLDYPGRNVDIYTNYLLRPSGAGWKIVDIFSPPAVSELRMRHAEYRRVLERKGHDGLIAAMDAKIDHWMASSRNQ
jgi:ABC-type transporter MlaC component